MGMSASQARYLLLTTEKTNAEYQGQQINQQRTTLANQTANYNNSLLTLKVPTPPSTSGFTKTTYNWTQGSQVCTYAGMTTNNNGTYRLSYTVPTVKDAASYQGVSTISTLTDGAGAITGYQANGNNLTLLTASLSDEDQTNTDLITGAFFSNQTPAPTYYKYQVGETVTYLSQAQVESLTSDTAEMYRVEETSSKEERSYDNVSIAWDTSGRMTSVTLQNDVELALSTTTVTDNVAYADAMNQYEFEKGQYEKAMNDINSKLEIIQAQDKTLELQLKELETAQKAYSTEIDAVKKVLEKNVETSFKTFG